MFWWDYYDYDYYYKWAITIHMFELQTFPLKTSSCILKIWAKSLVDSPIIYTLMGISLTVESILGQSFHI